MTATAAPAEVRFSTREEWLVSAVAALTPLFEAVGETVPAVRVSVGWPGGRGKKNSVIGQCWATRMSADSISEIFISPVLDEDVRVLDVLAHELVHAIDDCQSGHRGRFAKIAKGIGLTGSMTATVAGDELKATLEEISAELGAYPHAKLAAGAEGADGPKKQGTRMLKLEAPCCGYVVRTTQKWIDAGLPSCPCGNEMELA